MPAPNANLSALLEANKKHVTPALGRVHDHIIVKGAGTKVWDEEDKEYIDFTAGIGVTNLGHSHPAVTAAVINQVQQVSHVQCSIAYSVPYLQLIENLVPIMPDKSLDTFFFWNSGAEAIEFALKLVKRATQRPNIICMQGGYHGRTFAASSITRSKTVYTLGSQTMGGVYAAPFPYWHSLGVSPDTPEEELVEMAKIQLELLVKQQVAPSDVAAIFCEPVIGEGGYVPAPASWLRFLREFCDKHGMLLVIDEVQTGFGRTGKMWASEHVEGFTPDVMTFAKGLANGFPLSGVVSRREIMEKQEPGTIGGTYAGNAIACAAAVAVTEVFKTQPILENVNARSAQLFDTLNALKASPKTSNLIADVRGKGLMVAMEFRTDDALTRKGVTGAIPKDIGKRVQKKIIDQGIFVLTTSCFDTIRFIPPLVVTEEEMATACKAITQAVEEVAREG
jgi:4-aminobutyrate aminotransferase